MKKIMLYVFICLLVLFILWCNQCRNTQNNTKTLDMLEDINSSSQELRNAISSLDYTIKNIEVEVTIK